MLQIIQKRKIWFTIEITTVVLAIVFWAMWGLNLGIDFTGGSLMEIKFNADRPAVQELKAELDTLNQNIVLQPVGDTNYLLRFQSTDTATHQQIVEKLKAKYSDKFQEERFESIGPAIGQELKTKALYAIVLAILGIISYIAWAFRKVSWPVASWKYGVIAIVALIHDILVVIGVFAILGKVLNVEVDLPFVAALLTVLGYSVNDTIVIFDRIRENLGRVTKTTFEDIINRSVNETMARSINTTITTLLALIAIFFFGGESIKYFALALIIGITSGAYSSIFVASPLLVLWEGLQKKK